MKIRISFYAALIAFSCFGLHAQNKPQDKMTTAQSFSRQIAQTVRADYMLFLPKAYEAKADKRWPLILFLHGAGERGNDVWRANIHGPTKYIVNNPDFPFIVVSPLCPADQTWSNDVLIHLLDEISAKYKVDSTRVYLTGLSMGGFGTWSLAAAHPERFAAIAPICGGGELIPWLLASHGYSSSAKKQTFKGLSIWAFHGAKDNVVPLSESERMIEAAKKATVQEIKFTVYPEAQHDSWTATYNNPELYQWFLEHSRTAAK